jgi:predicted permease
MNSLLQDVRYALRQLRHAPGFALTAVTVLALGLGVNIAVFTVLDGILLRPLPYANPGRVVAVELSGPMQYYSLSYANMLQLRDAVDSRLKIGAIFTGGAAYASVIGPGGRYQVSHITVTAGLFDMLGVQPILGRAFREGENQPGQDHVLLIGEDVWRKVFNSDPQVVGKTLTVRHQAYTVVGVLPKGFFFWYASQMAVWSPAAIPPAARTAMSGKGTAFGWLFARLPEGITASQLAADMSRTQEVIAKEAPSDELPTRVKVTSYQESLTEDVRKPLMLLYGVVVGIWLLACMNVTSLMLARALSRSREHAVRAALGASRGRLLRQTIVESLVLSAIGASAGMLLGQSVIKLLWREIERQLPLTRAIHVDLRVVVCLVALTLLTAVCTGIFPALRAMRHDVRDNLSGVNSTASSGANRAREVLVVGQLALTLVFLVGAGLFLRTIHALRQVPLGFTQQNVLTGGIILNGAENGSNDSPSSRTNIVSTSYQPLLERLRAIPGVRNAALSSVLPFRAEMRVSISASIDHGKEQMADGRLASAGLDEALGIPMASGRFFNQEDTAGSPPVAVVNQAYANKYLPGRNPIGHTISMGKGRFNEIRIVGVVSDMKQFNLNDPTRPEVYFCLAQTEPGTPLYGIATAFMQVALRGAVPADNLRAQFDKALHEVAPDATTTNVKTIHEAVEDSFGSQTLIARLLETFAGLALMIASVGLYGLLSFVVAQRTREIGIRLALGAPQGNILSLILRRAVLLVVIGLGLGGVFAWFATRLAGSYIYGVREHDAVTLIAVTLVLAASSFLAAWLPARRAAAVDPILALRSE